MSNNWKFVAAAAAGTLVLAAGPAQADINVGISLSTTGPAAALGIPERNTVTLLPDTIAGEKVNYIVLDDATDASNAGKNARKLVDENKVDVLIGSSATPTAMAIAEVANESHTPRSPWPRPNWWATKTIGCSAHPSTTTSWPKAWSRT